jgi:hypothetical protein
MAPSTADSASSIAACAKIDGIQCVRLGQVGVERGHVGVGLGFLFAGVRPRLVDMSVPPVTHFRPVRRGLIAGGSSLVLESIGRCAGPISSAVGVALELIPSALTSSLILPDAIIARSEILSNCALRSMSAIGNPFCHKRLRLHRPADAVGRHCLWRHHQRANPVVRYINRRTPTVFNKSDRHGEPPNRPTQCQTHRRKKAPK